MFSKHTTNHPILSSIGGLLLIFLLVTFSPSVSTQSTDETQSLNWTVMAHRGFNPDWQCWMLQLDQVDGPHNETTGDFCAIDKADYDSHPDGSAYQTKGDWLDNLTKHLPNTDPSDHA